MIFVRTDSVQHGFDFIDDLVVDFLVDKIGYPPRAFTAYFQADREAVFSQVLI